MHVAGLGHICTYVAGLSLIVYVDVQITYSVACNAACRRTYIKWEITKCTAVCVLNSTNLKLTLKFSLNYKYSA